MGGKERSSNIELLRIISMFMIIGFHFAANGVMLCYYGASPNRLLQWADGSLTNQLFTAGLMPGGHIGVGIFFAISGYFLATTSHINYKKIFVQVKTYGALLAIAAIIAIMAGYSFPGLSKHGLVTNIILCLVAPVLGNIWWFVTAYAIVLFLQPFLNKILPTNKGLDVLLIIWVFGYSLSWFVSTGLTDIWRGVFFYLLGAYIRKSVPPVKLSKFNVLSMVVMLLVLWAVSSILLNYGYVNALSSSLQIKDYAHLSRAINEAIVVPAFVFIVFRLFANINLKPNVTINAIASTTFGIYLLHECPFLRPVIWQSTLHVLDFQYVSELYPLFAILSILSVFVIGMLIDFVRQKTLDLWLTRLTDTILVKLHYI